MDETMNLIRMAHEGDKNARDNLVLGNVGLIWSIVRRFAGRGYELEDLFQIGCIGLMKAIDKFDTSFEVKFSTYAVPMIKCTRESLAFSLGRDPTIDEIAQQIGASREEVAASIEAGAEVESLYKTVNKNDESNIYLIDKLVEENGEQEKIINNMVLKDLLSILGEQEQEIIVRRYYYNQTQSRIAQDLNISQVQVSRLEKRILKKMRERL